MPGDALLLRYREQGDHADCHALEIAAAVALEDYVEAFYRSRAFRPERVLLGLLLGMRSNDTDARRLARGEVDRFAAWSVEARTENQLLLCDFRQATRSWLMVEPIAGGTRLYFGSAVALAGGPGVRAGMARIVFLSLLGFHRVYSRVLLRSAARGLGLRNAPERVRP